MPAGKIRLIGGKWRSRKISVVNSVALRPTPDRVRETVFNWLAPVIHDAVCLDAFAGSGALGFEALSRGANSVTLIDNDTKVIQQLKTTQQELSAEHVDIIQADFLQHHFPAAQKFNIVFLDPPFHKNLIAQSCDYLQQQNLLAADALIYIEAEADLKDLSIPAAWEQLKHKIADEVGYYLYQSKHTPHPG